MHSAWERLEEAYLPWYCQGFRTSWRQIPEIFSQSVTHDTRGVQYVGSSKHRIDRIFDEIMIRLLGIWDLEWRYLRCRLIVSGISPQSTMANSLRVFIALGLRGCELTEKGFDQSVFSVHTNSFFSKLLVFMWGGWRNDHCWEHTSRQKVELHVKCLCMFFKQHCRLLRFWSRRRMTVSWFCSLEIVIVSVWLKLTRGYS